MCTKDIKEFKFEWYKYLIRLDQYCQYKVNLNKNDLNIFYPYFSNILMKSSKEMFYTEEMLGNHFKKPN